MRLRGSGAVLLCAASLWSAPPPAEWVPMRWTLPAQSLDLVAGTRINCLLLPSWTAELASAAQAKSLAIAAVLTPASDFAAEAARASAARLDAIVLEGDFPAGAAEKARAAFKGLVIELPARKDMQLGGGAPIFGSYQGLWPGIQVQENGATKAGPSGAPWIDTNTGFLRAARVWNSANLWISNQPPAKTVIPGDRYLQAIADAAISNAHWVIALDDDLAARLGRKDDAALKDWQRITQCVAYFESHPEWRAMSSSGKLAIVQDPAKGGLLSGGILDMIASRHTPVRPVPRQQLTPDALAGASMAVNIDPDALSPEQRETLRNFTRHGGTLLTSPPDFKDHGAPGKAITLDKQELQRLNDIFHDVNSMVGRRNLGVRLFNVSSMLSNLLLSTDGKRAVVHLVNYSGYPVENVAVHFLGKFTKATLLAPGADPKPLEVYQTEDGGGVDIEKVGTVASVTLE